MRVVIHTSGTTRLCPHCTRALLANIIIMMMRSIPAHCVDDDDIVDKFGACRLCLHDDIGDEPTRALGCFSAE